MQMKRIKLTKKDLELGNKIYGQNYDLPIILRPREKRK